MLSDCLLAGPVPRQFSGSSPALESSQSVSQPFNRCPESSQSASQPIKTALNLASQPVSHSKIALNLVVSQSASQPVSHSASQPVNQSPHRSPLVARTQRSNCLFRWFLSVFWLGQFPGSSPAVPPPSNLASQPVSLSKNALSLANQPVSQTKRALNLASQPVSQSKDAVNLASQPVGQSKRHSEGTLKPF